MRMFWRRHSPRLYRTISTSSDESYTSDSSGSSGCSHQHKPKAKPNPAASTSTMILSHVTQRPHNRVLSSSTRASTTSGQITDFCCQPESGPEVNQNQALSASNSDNSFDDSDFELREHSRQRGSYSPRSKWGITSILSKELSESMAAHGPEPVTEDAATFEPSPDITLPLLRYQKEWLAWGLDQEASEVRGGILNDESGMGKTIQAISLVITARNLRRHIPIQWERRTSSKGSNKCTLVICPLVALIQWEKEIEKCTVDGSATVLVFHGMKRPRGTVDFGQYDFVLTTYSTVVSDYRKYAILPKETCKYCSREFVNIKALHTHQRKVCSQNAKRTSLNPVYETKGKKKVDVMILTDCSAIRETLPLHSTRWERIIIDEAHLIKDRSNTAKAVFDLESEYKWALTATPLQNRVDDLYSLIRFLKLFPHSYYHCKDFNCCEQDYNSSTRCSHCEHSRLRHYCWWNMYIACPVENDSDSMHGQAMVLLKEKVLKSFLLRRTKLVRAADFTYPPKYVQLRQDSLDEKEKGFYEAMYTQSRALFDSYVEAGTLMNNYAHIFYMLTRLQQAVDHPYLMMYPSQPHACGLCNAKAKDPVITPCEHIFCKLCWVDYVSIHGRPICPTCVILLNVNPKRKPRKTSKVKGFKSKSILNRLDLSNFQTSTKIEALKEEIRNMLEDEGSAKAIILSQFTSFRDLIGYSLNQAGVKWVQLEGCIKIDNIKKCITTFTDDADCKILLMSLKAGGVAFNLVETSYVFLMDPSWNLAAEKQAQDQIHRIGQHKPMRVIRFVTEKTIEEKILAFQVKKELLFEGTVGRSSDALTKLSAEDLHFLFTI